jgi:hypothetical protein
VAVERYVGGECVIEAAVFPDDDTHVPEEGSGRRIQDLV